MQYHFTLKDNNEKAYKLFTWFLFFLHIVAAGWIVLQTSDDDRKWDLCILLGTYGLIAIGYYFFRKNAEVIEAFNLLLCVMYSFFWFKQSSIIACAIFVLIFLFAGVVRGKKTTVAFSETGIYFKKLFKTLVYPWAEMDNVILKDGLLTVDFVSNKLIQSEIALTDAAIDENDFNLFCQEQLQNKI